MVHATIERNARVQLSGAGDLQICAPTQAPTDLPATLLTSWVATSAAVAAQQPLDVEHEMGLIHSLTGTQLKDQHNSTARQAFSRKQDAVLASLERAAAGKVQLMPNKQRLAATAELTKITTRAQYQAFTQKQMDNLTHEALEVDYLSTRLSTINHLRVHCNEGWGISFVLVDWLIPARNWHSENVMLSFFGYMCFRLKGEGAIIAITHVTQFMLSIQIPAPYFPRLKNKMRLLRHKLSKLGKKKSGRSHARPRHVARLANRYRDESRNQDLPFWLRVWSAVKRCGVTGGFQLGMRVIEMFRGSLYNHKKHWAVKHFERAGACAIEDGEHITMRPTQRKCPTVTALMPVAIAFDADEDINFLAAYRELRELDPCEGKHHSRQRNHCAFRIDAKGTAPSAKQFQKEFKRDFREEFPDEAERFGFTGHVLRRGMMLCHAANRIDPVIIEQAAVLAPASTRGLYTGCAEHLMLDAQRRMPGTNYVNMQEDAILAYETDDDSDDEGTMLGTTPSESDSSEGEDHALVQTRPAARTLKAAAAAPNQTKLTWAKAPRIEAPASQQSTQVERAIEDVSVAATKQKHSNNKAAAFGTVKQEELQPGQCPLSNFSLGPTAERDGFCRQFQFSLVHNHKLCKRRSTHACCLCGHKAHGAFQGEVNKSESFKIRRYRLKHTKAIRKHFESTQKA